MVLHTFLTFYHFRDVNFNKSLIQNHHSLEKDNGISTIYFVQGFQVIQKGKSTIKLSFLQ